GARRKRAALRVRVFQLDLRRRRHAAQGRGHHRRAAVAVCREQAGERDVRRCVRALLRHPDGRPALLQRVRRAPGSRGRLRRRDSALDPRHPDRRAGRGERRRRDLARLLLHRERGPGQPARRAHRPAARAEPGVQHRGGRKHLAQPPARDPAHAAAGGFRADLPAVPRRRRAPLARRHLARARAPGLRADPHARKRPQAGSAVVPEAIRKRAGLAALSVAAAAAMPVAADDSAPATIARIKASIVAVGTFERLRNPQFGFAGTGFVVGDGLTVATNDHVVPKTVSTERGEDIAVAVPVPGGAAQIRIARRMAADAGSDLALLRMDGKPLPALAFGDAQAVREGESYLVTGFPIGSVLGLFPVTHRAMIAAVTPIAIPAARADQLDALSVRRLSTPSFAVFQLDATAYPGNSGSPVYHPESGAVVGIVNSVFVKATREAALAQPSGITYAIPARQLIELLQDAR